MLTSPKTTGRMQLSMAGETAMLVIKKVEIYAQFFTAVCFLTRQKNLMVLQ